MSALDEALANVERAARELDALLQPNPSHDGGRWVLDGVEQGHEAGAALLSLHDYLNDVTRARHAPEMPEPLVSARAAIRDADRPTRSALAVLSSLGPTLPPRVEGGLERAALRALLQWAEDAEARLQEMERRAG